MTGNYTGTLTLDYQSGGVESTVTTNFSLNVTQVSGFGFTLDTPEQTIVPGGTAMAFGATLDNGATDTTIDGYNFAVPGLTTDTSPFDSFFNTSGGALSALKSVKQSLFNVSASNSVVPGDYLGTATIFYSTNGVSGTALQPFVVHVATAAVVPEGGSVILMAAGIAFLSGVVIRRRRTTGTLLLRLPRLPRAER